MLVHGLIHLLGFSQEWLFSPAEKFAGRRVGELSAKASRFVGLLWLAACILFIAGAAFFIMNNEYFWIPVGLGLFLSQGLIILYWDDAKFGTIANVLVAIVVTFASANVSFVKRSESASSEVIDNARGEKILVTNEMIASLPPSVQTWLRHANVVGRPTNNVVRVRQEGQMRSDPDADWMPFAAEQVFSINPPAFVWTARIKAASIFEIAAIDKYQGGHGNMTIKALYLYKVADASGSEIDQGTLVRYLAEIAWFPQAAASDYIRWEEITPSQARATMTYQGVTASAVFSFDKDGNLKSFEADRFGDFNGEFRKEKWIVTTSRFKTMNEATIGTESEVTWRLSDGNFTWLKLEILSVE
jgi:hypothetical protein